MDLQNIQDQLNTEFSKPSVKYIFWFDDKAEYENEVSELALDNAKLQVLDGRNWLYSKWLFSESDADSKYLIYAPFSFKNIAGLLYGSYAEITRIGSLTSLWYLSCLFSARIIVQALISLLGFMGVKNFEKWCVVFALILFAIGLNIPVIEGGYLWNFDVAFIAGGFILLGMALRLPILILAQQENFILALVFIASLILFYVGTFARADSLDLSIMANATYGNIFYFFYNSIFGTILILLISMIIARFAHESPHPFSLNFMTYYIGQHTLGIFLLHKNFLWEVAMPFTKNFMAGYPEFSQAFIGAVISFIFAAVMCLIIERFVPQLLGQFPRYEQ